MGVKPVGDKPLQSSRKKPSSARGTDKEFRDMLARTGESDTTDKLHGLFEGIESAAGELIESKDEASLKAYRNRIKEFLQEVLAESREVKVIIKDSIYEDPLVIVKIVDKKLDELAEVVLREELERGDIPRIMDEIRGILVDLYK